MGEKDLYTGGPHGLLSCFITNVIPGILLFFQLQARPSVTPINECTEIMFLFDVTGLSAAVIIEGSNTRFVPSNKIIT